MTPTGSSPSSSGARTTPSAPITAVVGLHPRCSCRIPGPHRRGRHVDALLGVVLLAQPQQSLRVGVVQDERHVLGGTDDGVAKEHRALPLQALVRPGPGHGVDDRFEHALRAAPRGALRVLEEQRGEATHALLLNRVKPVRVGVTARRVPRSSAEDVDDVREHREPPGVYDERLVAVRPRELAQARGARPREFRIPAAQPAGSNRATSRMPPRSAISHRCRRSPRRA